MPLRAIHTGRNGPQGVYTLFHVSVRPLVCPPPQAVFTICGVQSGIRGSLCDFAFGSRPKIGSFAALVRESCQLPRLVVDEKVLDLADPSALVWCTPFTNALLLDINTGRCQE